MNDHDFCFYSSPYQHDDLCCFNSTYQHEYDYSYFEYEHIEDNKKFSHQKFILLEHIKTNRLNNFQNNIENYPLNAAESNYNKTPFYSLPKTTPICLNSTQGLDNVKVFQF